MSCSSCQNSANVNIQSTATISLNQANGLKNVSTNNFGTPTTKKITFIKKKTN